MYDEKYNEIVSLYYKYLCNKMKQTHSYSKRQIAFIKGYRRYFPFIVCLAISTILWFTREMGKDYEKQLSIKLRFENLPKSKALVSTMPSKLLVTVQSTGWGLLRQYIMGEDCIVIDVSALDEKGVTQFSTKESSLFSNFGTQLHVVEVYPSEITFRYEPVASKRVPVKTDISITFARQYELDGDIVVSPDTITIYGASATLDKISEVECESLELKKMKDSFAKSLKISPINNVDFSTSKVKISGKIEKFTEQSISIPIKLLNVPTDSSVVVDLMRDKVVVQFLIPINRVEDYFPSDFEAVADYEKQSANGMLPVEIVRFPQFARIIQQSMQSVGVIIQKND